MVVTVYSLPNCVSCDQTKRQFAARGIDFVDEPLTGDLLERFRSEGHLSAPVVVVDCGDDASWSWSGYRHDDIRKLAGLAATAAV